MSVWAKTSDKQCKTFHSFNVETFQGHNEEE